MCNPCLMKADLEDPGRKGRGRDPRSQPPQVALHPSLRGWEWPCAQRGGGTGRPDARPRVEATAVRTGAGCGEKARQTHFFLPGPPSVQAAPLLCAQRLGQPAHPVGYGAIRAEATWPPGRSWGWRQQVWCLFPRAVQGPAPEPLSSPGSDTQAAFHWAGRS